MRRSRETVLSGLLIMWTCVSIDTKPVVSTTRFTVAFTVLVPPAVTVMAWS